MTLKRNHHLGSAMRANASLAGEKRFHVQSMSIWAEKPDTHLQDPHREFADGFIEKLVPIITWAAFKSSSC